MSSFLNVNSHRAIAACALAVMIAAEGSAAAQQVPATFDTSQQIEIKGRVAQYTLTPRGDIDGLILADGAEVKFPPHLSAQTAFVLKPGDSVTIRGVRAYAPSLFLAASIANDATGRAVIDDGGPAALQNQTETAITGKVARVLHGPMGDVNGVLLDSSVILRIPPPEAPRWASLMQPGQVLSARGVLMTTALGSVLDARAIGASPDQLSQLAWPPRPPAPSINQPPSPPAPPPGPRP